MEGAFAANDLKVIYSETFKGAVLLSGGPYNAAAYHDMKELNIDELPDLEYLAQMAIEKANQNSESRLIDGVSHL